MRNIILYSSVITIALFMGNHAYGTNNPWDQDRADFLNKVQTIDIREQFNNACAPRGKIAREQRAESAKFLLTVKDDVDYLLPIAKVGGFKNRLVYIQNEFENLNIDWSKMEITAGLSDATVIKFTSVQQFDSSSDLARQNLFVQNQDCVKNKYSVNGTVFDLPQKTKQSQQGSFMCDYMGKKIPFGQFNTQMNVVNEDSINHAINLISNNQIQNPLIMDMAHPSMVCGLASNGKGNAQEEQIAFRSNLYSILSPFKKSGKPDEYFIPYQGGIYASKVSILRDDARHGYAFRKDPIELDIYAVAAFRHDNRIKSNKIADSQIFKELQDSKIYWQRTENKIRSMFEAAVLKGNDSLVLGAFGTGAFENPIPDIIRIYQNVINDYQGVFKRIDFAVFDPKNYTFNAFSKAFNGK